MAVSFEGIEKFSSAFRKQITTFLSNKEAKIHYFRVQSLQQPLAIILGIFFSREYATWCVSQHT